MFKSKKSVCWIFHQGHYVSVFHLDFVKVLKTLHSNICHFYVVLEPWWIFAQWHRWQHHPPWKLKFVSFGTNSHLPCAARKSLKRDTILHEKKFYFSQKCFCIFWVPNLLCIFVLISNLLHSNSITQRVHP